MKTLYISLGGPRFNGVNIPASQHPSIPASQHPSIPAFQHPSISSPALPQFADVSDAHGDFLLVQV
ncbi:MAG: hypothetical protein KGY41_09070, partial [Desulfovermiculus sp.]|nr:hypothetical protein [Desulfovermiculus sp.]